LIRSSLRNKLIVFVLVATILPMTTFLLIMHFFTKDKLEEKAVQDSVRLIYQGKGNLLNYVQSVQQSIKLIYNNEPLMDMLRNKLNNYFEENRLFATEQEIVRTLLNVEYAVNDSRQVYLYVKQADRSFLVSDNRLIRPDLNGEPYRPAIKTGHFRTLPPHPMDNYGKSLFQYSDAQVITFVHSLYDLFSKTELGSLSIDVNVETIREICEQLYAKNEEQLYILDESYRLFYASDQSLIGKSIDSEWSRQLKLEQESQSDGSFRMRNAEFSGIYIYDNVQTAYGRLTFVKGVPDSYIFRHEQQLLQINTLIGSAFLVVAIVATILISIRLTSPIGELIGYMNRIELGNMDVDIRVRGNDELSSLARRFKSMMHTINELFMREYRLEVANKRNELKALQAQINPHFLNNALQSIGHVALQQGNRQVYALITSLGKMMRYGMNTNETIVPLREEVDYVRTYLKLQKLRFREQFEQLIECDPEAEPILVPKMLLQPLVENYFKHGFQGVQGEGLIVIDCRLAQDRQTLEVVVSDNGAGVTEAELDELRQRLSGSHAAIAEPHTNIGLVNVLSRLRLYYRDNASMSVESVSPSGFRVSLFIPVYQQNLQLTEEAAHEEDGGTTHNKGKEDGE